MSLEHARWCRPAGKNARSYRYNEAHGEDKYQLGSCGLSLTLNFHRLWNRNRWVLKRNDIKNIGVQSSSSLHHHQRHVGQRPPLPSPRRRSSCQHCAHLQIAMGATLACDRMRCRSLQRWISEQYHWPCQHDVEAHLSKGVCGLVGPGECFEYHVCRNGGRHAGIWMDE